MLRNFIDRHSKTHRYLPITRTDYVRSMGEFSLRESVISSSKVREIKENEKVVLPHVLPKYGHLFCDVIMSMTTRQCWTVSLTWDLQSTVKPLCLLLGLSGKLNFDSYDVEISFLHFWGYNELYSAL